MSSDPAGPVTPGPDASAEAPVDGSVADPGAAPDVDPVDPAGDPVVSDQDQPAEPADLVLQAVLAVPGVHDVHAGMVGEVATLLPGRRVNGLRLHDGGCEVHLVLEHGVEIAATADRVREALRGLVAGAVDIHVEDVVAPGAQLGAPRDRP